MAEDLANWAQQFRAFHARFAPYFFRAEVRQRSRHYLQALLDQVERKNGWQLAEAMGELAPDGTQRLLYAAVWDAEAVRDELERFVTETFGHPEGILVVDESGIPKKGPQSVGVAKQYCGRLGKVENCQVGVFLAYASPKGRAFLDRRLYLPEGWTDDPPRCRTAKVPADVGFATKPALAQAMLAHALGLGVPAAWVTADEVYGTDPALRAFLEEQPLAYVLAVRRTETLVLPPPVRPQLDHVALGTLPVPKPRLVGLLDTPVGVAAKLPPEQWERHSAGSGSQGERWSDWALVPLAEPAGAGWGKWLLLRRSLTDDDLAAFRVFAPQGTALTTLARVAGARWTMEQCLEEAKGEAGLDQYEVRHWPSWHRHVTLAMLAHAFLATLRASASGGRGPAASADRGRRGAAERARSAPPPGTGAALAAAHAAPPAALVPLAASPPGPCQALPHPPAAGASRHLGAAALT